LTILFVHFGENLPRHLVANLIRSADIFSSRRLVLVTDAIKPANSLPSNVEVIHPETLDWPSGREKLNRDQRFWNGWWQKTFDRLLVIRPVHSLYPQESLLQVESDTILFPRFPFETLEKQSKISYPLYSTNMAVASVLFSPNIAGSERLEHELLSELSENAGTSDMLALGAIVGRLGADFQRMMEFPSENSDSTFIDFENLGLFDGLSHGDWICGRDPRAHWGVGARMQLSPNSIIRKSVEYFLDANQIYARNDGKIFPLNNLHVHSKESMFFQASLNVRVNSILQRLNQRPKSGLRYFDIAAFVYCLKSNVRIWSSSIMSKSAWKRLWRRLFKKVR